MKVGSAIHRKDSLNCLNYLNSLDENEFNYSCFGRNPAYSTTSHGFYCDDFGFSQQPALDVCLGGRFYDPCTGVQDINYMTEFDQLNDGTMAGGLYQLESDGMDYMSSDFNMSSMSTPSQGCLSQSKSLTCTNTTSTTYFDTAAISYLEHDPLGIMNFPEVSYHRHSPMLCDAVYSTPNNVATHNHHRMSVGGNHPSRTPGGTLVRADLPASSVALITSYPTASIKTTPQASYILKEVQPANANNVNFSAMEPESSNDASYRKAVPSFGVINCRKKKAQNKSKESDESAMAKRQKHNAMEKVRRRVVADGFESLAQVLHIRTGRKPSKATILVKAKESIQALFIKTQDIRRDTHEIAERRFSLVKRLSAFRKL